MSTPAASAVPLPSIPALAALTAIGPLSLSVVVPSMPGLQSYFGVDYTTAQLAITAYMLAFALGQLVIGPVSDAIGRRPMLLAGLCIYLLGSALGLAAWSIEALVFARFVQGIGGCAGIVLGRAMIRDVYSRDQSASAIAYVTMAMVVAPMFAPSIGGFLDSQFGWRANFMLLLAVGASALTLALLQVRETRTTTAVAVEVGAVLRSFAALLSMPAFLAYALVLASSTGMFFSFLSGGTFIVIDLLGYSPAVFGAAFVGLPLMFMTGNFISARFATRVGADPLIAAGCGVGLLGAIALAGIVAADLLSIWTLFAAVSLTSLANGLVMPNTTAILVSLRPDLAGAAAGLGGSIQFGVGALSTVVVASLTGTSAVPLVATLFVLAVVAIIAYVAARAWAGPLAETG